MELIGWQRERESERKVGEKGDDGWKWQRTRGWDKESVRNRKEKKF